MNIKKGSLCTREAHYRPTVYEKCNTPYLARQAYEKEYEQNARTPFLFRQVLLLRVILSVVRPRSCSADASHCYAVRLRYASLRMTRADAVETRRANSNAVRISQEVFNLLYGTHPCGCVFGFTETVLILRYSLLLKMLR